jgi:hypothetical protein
MRYDLKGRDTYRTIASTATHTLRKSGAEATATAWLHLSSPHLLSQVPTFLRYVTVRPARLGAGPLGKSGKFTHFGALHTLGHWQGLARRNAGLPSLLISDSRAGGKKDPSDFVEKDQCHYRLAWRSNFRSLDSRRSPCCLSLERIRHLDGAKPPSRRLFSPKGFRRMILE